MKKILQLFALILLCGATQAYTSLSETQHQQIDIQLSGFSTLSSKEKAKNADFFLKLAQKSLIITQNIQGGNRKILRSSLTKTDLKQIQEKTENIKRQTLNDQSKILKELKETEKIAQELGRSLQIESLPTFQGYGITQLPTPLYRIDKDKVDINNILGGKGSTGIKLDQQNLIRELAVVVPEGTVLSLISEHKIGDFTYYQVRNREFDSGIGTKYAYFIDSRFIKKVKKKPAELLTKLPQQETIIRNLNLAKGSSYVWGGSRYQGLTQMENFFPSDQLLTPAEKKQKEFKGVDCSGLLREATAGNTPRNTRQLLNFGEAVNIEGKSLDQIISSLKPLDLIVWDGHVVIMLDQYQTIESRWRANFKGGVEITNIRDRLNEIMKNRIPVNDYTSSKELKSKKFVIRRRYPES